MFPCRFRVKRLQLCTLLEIWPLSTLHGGKLRQALPCFSEKAVLLTCVHVVRLGDESREAAARSTTQLHATSDAFSKIVIHARCAQPARHATPSTAPFKSAGYFMRCAYTTVRARVVEKSYFLGVESTPAYSAGLRKNALPEGVELTLSELEEMACRQQHQIEAQRQLLAAKEQRLRFLKQHEARHQQVAHEHERLRRLRDRVEAQELKLKKLRALRGQVDHTKLNNASLRATFLKARRASYREKLLFAYIADRAKEKGAKLHQLFVRRRTGPPIQNHPFVWRAGNVGMSYDSRREVLTLRRCAHARRGPRAVGSRA
ncbi:unnamed protein product [Bemisia tabaci]|uniref:Uncharacterized protein n=1 Tax=Bemisia tabaci TaxID=7038 RepID=A0A9P0AK74_BEMTA|nr:unnamed protein product [Bemisia tabaci]